MQRPKITNVLASSINGLIAGSPIEPDSQRKSYNLTNQEDQSHLVSIMANCDAIITGANSLRSESGLRPENGIHGHPPTWVVFTTKGVHKDHFFWKQKNIKRVLVSPSLVDCFDDDVMNLECGSNSPVDTCIEWLTQNQFKHALLFGGGSINQMFYKKRLVDELILTVSPVLFQAEESVNIIPSNLSPVSMKLLNSKSDASHNLYLHYKIQS